jgi:hypothetical protein
MNFLLYRHLRYGLEAGDVFCRDSVRFRSMKDDLLSDDQWSNKDKLIAEAGLDILQQPIETHLKDLEEQLETRIAEVNRRIATGENRHFKLKAGGIRWTLEYPSDSEAVNHPFFDQLPQTDIVVPENGQACNGVADAIVGLTQRASRILPATVRRRSESTCV